MTAYAQTQAALILGGARSGKSRHALDLAASLGLPPLLLATAEALDPEMAERIARHRAERPAGWRTVEVPHHLAPALERETGPDRVVVVDCLTLWLSNRMLAGADVEREAKDLTDAVAATEGPVILVANEVGLGIVPDNALARRFRDAAGRLNQSLAGICGTVRFIAAGLPLDLKRPQAGIFVSDTEGSAP